MIDRAVLVTAVPAMLAIIVVPGPDLVFVLAKSAAGGARSGLTAVAGIISGGVVHVGGAALGLSALVLRSSVLFEAIRFAGAAYLVVIGARTLLAWRGAEAGPERAPGRAGATFAQGFLTNALNPKAALFVLAFLPQFVEPARGHVAEQVLALGGIWYGLGATVYSGVALAGAGLGRARRRNVLAGRAARVFTGCVLVAIGLRVGLA